MSAFCGSHSSAPMNWKHGHWQQPRWPAAGGQWSPHQSFEQNVKCQLCFSFGQTASQCTQFRSSGYQPSTHLAVSLIFAPTWFPDTCANQHVTLDLARIWPILHFILVMITCMLVTIRVYQYPILDIPCYIPLNAPSHYLMFSIFLTLPNHC
jgi:hypothetical protein